ncbi:pilus assembly protein N-terminal domain-containing protein [Brevundimonas vesicularis]|uniref:pilus assembly protein N-terminal domain-containing protein n=1 Tax=Brevundimonas vesicularis TaxID=41276 RepID=UPI0038D3DE90
MPKSAGRPAGALFLMLASLMVASPVLAETASSSLTVEIDRSTRLSLRGPASSIIVANPRVADVTLTDASTLFVTGKGYGSTEIIAMDAAGRILLQTQVVVGGASSGSVRLWRGAQVTDVACGTTCSPSQRPDGGQ